MGSESQLRPELAAAEASARRAVELNPLDLQARMRLADALRRLGRDGDARAELAVVAELCANTGAGTEALSWLRGLQLPPERAIPLGARVAHPLAPGEDPFADDEPTHPGAREPIHLLLDGGPAEEIVDAQIISVIDAGAHSADRSCLPSSR